MLASTVSKLRCPRSRCSSAQTPLRIHAVKSIPIQTTNKEKLSDVWSGHVECPSCQSKYPILSGVLILVEHVRDYLCVHVKGISKHVADTEIPDEYRKEYREVKVEYLAEQGKEYMEEDLESERVTALYLMNHYLKVSDSRAWFESQKGSPLIEKLIADHWDQGPFAVIAGWMKELRAQKSGDLSVVELGCGVGGFSRMMKESGSYLGVDSSFASIALARHLNLGVPYGREIKIPGDLIDGAVSRAAEMKPEVNANCDFILADLEELPLKTESFDGSIALNAIDMLEEPSKLPKMQFDAVKKNGFAIQSCPYIWHAKTAKRLRSKAPKAASDSVAVVEWLYEKTGFKIEKRETQIPWLFFKHFRQLEIYSVHAFLARKK